MTIATGWLLVMTVRIVGLGVAIANNWLGAAMENGQLL